MELQKMWVSLGLKAAEFNQGLDDVQRKADFGVISDCNTRTTDMESHFSCIHGSRYIIQARTRSAPSFHLMPISERFSASS